MPLRAAHGTASKLSHSPTTLAVLRASPVANDNCKVSTRKGHYQLADSDQQARRIPDDRYIRTRHLLPIRNKYRHIHSSTLFLLDECTCNVKNHMTVQCPVFCRITFCVGFSFSSNFYLVMRNISLCIYVVCNSLRTFH